MPELASKPQSDRVGVEQVHQSTRLDSCSLAPALGRPLRVHPATRIDIAWQLDGITLGSSNCPCRFSIKSLTTRGAVANTVTRSGATTYAYASDRVRIVETAVVFSASVGCAPALPQRPGQFRCLLSNAARTET